MTSENEKLDQLSPLEVWNILCVRDQCPKDWLIALGWLKHLKWKPYDFRWVVGIEFHQTSHHWRVVHKNRSVMLINQIAIIELRI